MSTRQAGKEAMIDVASLVDRLVGNELDQTVTWNGKPDLGHDNNSPVILQFKMRCAQLFSVEFK